MPRWLYFYALAGATLVVVGAVVSTPFDFRIYRWGANQVLHSPIDLYSGVESASGMGFTYPPLAAVVLAWTSAIPAPLAAGVWALLSWACLLRVLWLLTPASVRAWPRWALPLAVIAATAIEPVITTLSLGQINLVLLWMVIEDWRRGPNARLPGALIGVAAGLKLTPALFIVMLFLAGQRRAWITAAGSFIFSAACAWFIAPQASRIYFGGVLLDSTRVAGNGSQIHPGNQSVNGLIWRLVGDGGSSVAWATSSLLLLAVWTSWVRLSDAKWPRLEALAATAIVMLLISPVSWTHHWVWLLPAVSVLLKEVNNERRAYSRILLFGWCLALFSWFNKWAWSLRETDFIPLLSFVAWNPYVLLSLATFIWIIVDGAWRQRWRNLRVWRLRLQSLCDASLHGRCGPTDGAPGFSASVRTFR